MQDNKVLKKLVDGLGEKTVAETLFNFWQIRSVLTPDEIIELNTHIIRKDEPFMTDFFKLVRDTAKEAANE